MVHKAFKKFSLILGLSLLMGLISTPSFSVSDNLPRVVHVGQSTGGGHFAVVNAGTSNGFAAGSEICLFDSKDQLVLCTKVLVAKSRVAALRLTNRQYPKAAVSLVARLSAAPASTNDSLELAPSYFFRDGRSAEEIKKIETALSRLEPATVADATANQQNTGAKPTGRGDRSVTLSTGSPQFSVTPETTAQRQVVGKRFQVGYAYHLLSPVVYNNIAVQGIAKDGTAVWGARSRQQSAPLGAELAFLIPVKTRVAALRIFAAGSPAANADSKIIPQGEVSGMHRDYSTRTASHFFGAALGGSWPVTRGEFWTLWINPELVALRSVVEVSAEFDGAPTKDSIAKLGSTLHVLMPELSGYMEWIFGYAGVSAGLRAGLPWKSQAVGKNESEENNAMAEALAHDPSKFALGSFVAGTMRF